MGALIPATAIPGVRLGEEKAAAIKRFPYGSMAREASKRLALASPTASSRSGGIGGGTVAFRIGPRLLLATGVALPKLLNLTIRTQSTWPQPSFMARTTCPSR